MHVQVPDKYNIKSKVPQTRINRNLCHILPGLTGNELAL